MPFYRVVLNESLTTFNLLEMKPDDHNVPNTHMIYLTPITGTTECPLIYIWGMNELCSGSTATVYSYISGTVSSIYQWYVNGNPVSLPDGGESKLIYIPENGDLVYCTLSGDTCGLITSNTVEFKLVAKSEPTVTINWTNVSVIDETRYICSGDTILFSTSYTHGGTYPYPTFQWYSNKPSFHAIPGETGSTMTYQPISGETIGVYMGSNEWCIYPTGATDMVIMDVAEKLFTSVSITSFPSGPVCTGTSVTYTATGVNGGSTPIYQWYVNGVSGETWFGSSFTYTPENGNVISVTMTSSLKCVSGVAKNYIITEVNPWKRVYIEIESIPKSVIDPTPPDDYTSIVTIKSGDIVTFYVEKTTGTCDNDNDNVYQWILYSGGTWWNVGTDDRTFVLTNPQTNNIIKCILSTNCNCRYFDPYTSNGIKVIVELNPDKYVYIEGNNEICSGTTVCFTGHTYNFDISPTPTYQWKLSLGADPGWFDVGTNSPYYCSSNLANGDEITLVVNQTIDYTSQNTITMIVDQKLNSTVTIDIYPYGLTYCNGEEIYFVVVDATNYGDNPSWQWQKYNGGSWSNIGSNLSYYLTNNLIDKDIIRVIMTPIETCINPSTSNEIQVTILSDVLPSVSISANLNCITLGSPITLTAISTYGGSSPIYNWYLDPDYTNPVYTGNPWTTTFTKNEIIICKMISNLECAIGNKTVISNSLNLELCGGDPECFNNILIEIYYKIYEGHGCNRSKYAVWLNSGLTSEINLAWYTGGVGVTPLPNYANMNNCSCTPIWPQPGCLDSTDVDYGPYVQPVISFTPTYLISNNPRAKLMCGDTNTSLLEIGGSRYWNYVISSELAELLISQNPQNVLHINLEYVNPQGYSEHTEACHLTISKIETDGTITFLNHFLINSKTTNAYINPCQPPQP